MVYVRLNQRFGGESKCNENHLRFVAHRYFQPLLCNKDSRTTMKTQNKTRNMLEGVCGKCVAKPTPWWRIKVL